MGEDVNETKEQKQAAEVVRCYKATFKNPQGKTVLRDMALNASLYSPSSSLDPQDLAYKEGQRSVIIAIFNTLNMDYDEVLKLYASNSYLGDEDEGEEL